VWNQKGTFRGFASLATRKKKEKREASIAGKLPPPPPQP